MNKQGRFLDSLTARRYNLVSVPPAGGWHAFLQSGYKGGRVLLVSRYKIEREQVSSQGTQSFIAGTGVVAVQAFTDLSRGQEQSAKTMTSLLIIPTLLGCVLY